MYHKKHMAYANASSADIGRLAKHTGMLYKAEIHSKDFGGTGIHSGHGTIATNTMFMAGISRRGMREALSAKGPGSRW